MMMMMLLLLLLLLLLLMIVLMLLLHPMSSRSSLRAGNDAGCLRSLWGYSGWLLRTSFHRLLDLQFRLAARVELIHCLKLEVKFLQLVEPWGARLHCRDNLTQRALIDRLDTSRTCNLSIHLSTNLIARLDKKVLHLKKENLYMISMFLF